MIKNDSKLSIITINLNNKAGLEKTIQSVISQTYTDFEYILIDGGSTDGSVEVIKRNENKIAYWVSEKDKGIYNAMNKGILKATGEYCLFINSGDFFIKSTILEEMSGYINGEDILYGNGFFEAKNNTLDKLECPVKLTLGFFTLYCLLHPCTLIKKSLFDKYGLYNESNKIVSDGEFFIKTTILNNVKTKLIPLEIAIAEENGISRNIEYKAILDDERKKLFSNFFPGYVLDLMDDYKDLKLENMNLSYENNKLFSEINGYKNNIIFRAILKIMRLLNRVIHTS
jgi:glycosyltransferase involved in cell wall biosynthesis